MCALFGACVLLAPACKKKFDGPLEAPAGAASFENRFAIAFDDKYTGLPLEMGGRAPNDVFDQRLFAARLGYSDIVMEVTVTQVWARGRYQGRPEQYLDVRLGDVIIGEEVPKRTADDQLLVIDPESDLSGVEEGQTLLMFLRWAPGLDPSFRHHLMPKDEEILELVHAMVEHAEEEGHPVVGGKKARKRAKKRARQKAKREKKQGSGGEDSEG